MFWTIEPSGLLRYAGLLTWAVIALPLLLLSGTQAVQDDAGIALLQQPLGWQPWLAWLLFGLCYGGITRKLGRRKVGWADYLLLLLLNASAIALSHYTSSGLGSILLMVAACVLPWLLPLVWGVVFLLLSEIVMIPLFMRGGLHEPMSLGEATMQAVLYLGVTGFVFATSLLGRQQALARDEQHRLNAELRATRVLLAESARVNERIRIAHELHDLLGHHLTALSLNLEVAGHLLQHQAPAQEHLQRAHTLAKLLLSDVREAVSQIRDTEHIDMAAALTPLASNVPGLHIDLQMPVPFIVDMPEKAHVLLRCTQEIVTNTVRHAKASHLQLRFFFNAQGVCLQARDNGRGVAEFTPGNGLRGMHERLRAQGGTLQVQNTVGEGFALEINLPLTPLAV